MRITPRLVTTAALTAFAIAALTGCSAATQEERAIAEYEKFVEATANGGELNICEDNEAGDFSEVSPSKIREGANLEVEVNDAVLNPDYAGRVDVSGEVDPLDSEESSDRKSTLWIQFDEDEDPCVMMKWSPVW